MTTLDAAIRAATERPHITRARALARRGIVPGTRAFELRLRALLAWAEQTAEREHA